MGEYTSTVPDEACKSDAYLGLSEMVADKHMINNGVRWLTPLSNGWANTPVI